jgi:hypothetical protein
MGKIVCPKCEKDDQMQKVTSIRTGGVSTTNYGNVYGGRETAVSVTSLASRLSPPINSVQRYSFVAIWFYASVGITISTFVILNTFLHYGDISFSGCMNIAIIEVIISGILALVINTTSAKKFRDGESDAQRKMEKYLQLYYCFRDDCVFDPNTNKHTSPEGMDRLL